MNEVQDIFRRVKGKRTWRENIMPMAGHDNLAQGASWDRRGYTVEPFLPASLYQTFLDNVRQQFVRTLENNGIALNKDKFKLENYHEMVKNQHLSVINELKHLKSCNFPIELSVMENRISEILGFKVYNFNPLTRESVYHYRVVRPQKPDYNPLHRDTWHPEYEDCINIYVPLAGSDANSSLPLIPNSHYWSDAEFEVTPDGAVFNDVQFTVPAVANSKKNLELVRPNPGENEVMLFSPYLVHGAGRNPNTDRTRISLEMRFWRK